MKTDAELIEDLYRKRLAAKKARNEWIKRTKELNAWGEHEEGGMCHGIGHAGDMCDICRELQPLYLKQYDLRLLAGAALRSVLARGRKLCAEDAEK